MVGDTGGFGLRPPRVDDVHPYTTFLADPEVSVWLDDSVQCPISPSRVEAILLREAWCLWAIEWEGRFVGVSSLYEPDPWRRTARFSIVIGDRTCWGRGLGTRVAASVIDYGFATLGLRKISSDYLAPNQASRVLHQRVGFVEEGCLRRDAWRRGAWVDRILLSLLSDDERAKP